MATWHLPGGHRITGVPDVPEEFTPTAEEWFYSTILPPNLYRMYTDKSGETMAYFALNTYMAAISAWYAGGNSLGALRMMQIGSSFVTLSPAIFAVAAAAGYVSTADVHGGATGMLVGDMNMGLPVRTESSGSSSDILPGLEEHPFWPWNW